ncbi:hypothetical protein Nepgr_019508 [Nepenthes gracilis]|uniref:Late embryogenesis abundant protein LEA-2 subgroup domain-containing protein n=1 Tax=Nepenthes gracilis TaxID=150966 RepID=A0AAD3XU74_NEPGR|nr:hypothetical protein Nepgr_019508 [Nepenthes gracilis]
MASYKSDPVYYAPIPPVPHQPQQPPQNYIVLPLVNPSATRLRRSRYRTLWAAIPFVLLAIAVYVFWPSNPDLEIVRLELHRVRVRTRPPIVLDVSLAVTVRVRNRDFYSIHYRRLDVALGYRGKELGRITSTGGHVRARGSSYVNAIVDVDGVEVLSDWIYFLDDLAKGMVPFDTLTQVDGQLGFLFLELPLKAKISCEVDVNMKDQTVIGQNCYPEVGSAVQWQ